MSLKFADFDGVIIAAKMGQLRWVRGHMSDAGKSGFQPLGLASI
jgi:hypothetical protein